MDRRLQIALTVACGVALVLSFFSIAPWMPYLAIAAGSVTALRAAWRAVVDRVIDVNVLMVFAAFGAVTLGLLVEAAVLLFLFALSATLEEFALARTQSAIEGLIKLRPDKAVLVEDGQDRDVPVKDLKVGQLVRILPFEGIPVDAEIVEGSTSVDQAAMTGEARHAPKTVGDNILAGTQNQDGMVVARVTAAVGDTTLEKIVRLVRQAQENKASGERISAWFGSRYTLFVVGAFAVSLIVRLLIGQDWNHAIYASLSLFVALSPCALVISVPATTLSALAWSARNGILVRGGEFIEALGRADTVALDKTGTLTVGQPRLDSIYVCGSSTTVTSAGPDECDELDACWARGEEFSPEAREILRVAAASEQYSTHPIAEAIVEAAREIGIEVRPTTDHRVVPGMGVIATVDGKRVRVGQRRFFEQDQEQLPASFVKQVEELQSKGLTVAIAEYDGGFVALALIDHIRPEVSSTVDELKELGFDRRLLLTGDTPQTAEAIGSQAGLEEIHASLLPDDKERIVAQLVDEGRHVMMVGDGVNDAPSLARSSVGVAMGGLGSDVALNAADVVLMHDRLDRLPDLVKLGRKTNTIIKQNLYFATGVIVVLLLGSLIWDAFFQETRNLILPFAVVGHEGSTVLVILNGLRLLRGP